MRIFLEKGVFGRFPVWESVFRTLREGGGKRGPEWVIFFGLKELRFRVVATTFFGPGK